jgi:hypothetical protein
MINWYLKLRKKPKKELLAVLSTTKELVLKSKNDGWPDVSPIDTALEIDELIAYILNPEKNTIPEYASILYAPTGSLQEIAMSNGWHDDYLSLSE